MSRLLFEIVNDETAQEYMLDVADLIAVGGPDHQEYQALTMAVDRIANNTDTHRLVICAKGPSGKKALKLMREKLISAMKKYGGPDRVGVGVPVDLGGDLNKTTKVGPICASCQDVAEVVDPTFGICDKCWKVGCNHNIIKGTLGQPSMTKNGIAQIAKIVADSVPRETIGGNHG